jgi:hypothetical protein
LAEAITHKREGAKHLGLLEGKAVETVKKNPYFLRHLGNPFDLDSTPYCEVATVLAKKSPLFRKGP